MYKTNSVYLLLPVLLFLFYSIGCTPNNRKVKDDAVSRPSSEWVYHNSEDGKLRYKKTSTGDRIMDFSFAGYMGGGVALPEVPVRKTVAPSDGDDIGVIQQAINDVAAMPMENGFRGAILLEPGVFQTSETIRIADSGVVLRGSGSEGSEKTTIELTGDPHIAIEVAKLEGSDHEKVLAETVITDDYVPSGVKYFTVVDASDFEPGDIISIRKPVTKDWVEFMNMDDLIRDGEDQTWLEIGSTINTERTIVAISGNKIKLDVPLSDSYDGKYLNPPGISVVKISPPERISKSGVEHLHIKAPAQAINQTQSHFKALRMDGANLWAKDLHIEETMNSVGVSGRRITLKQVHIKREARSKGVSRPAEFAPNGSQVLLDRCSVEAENVWFIATGARVSGPIVILNSTFRGESRVESHQRWSTGMLYDNVRAPQGGIEFRNRGSMGSGHGWSMGCGVAWNTVADRYIIQRPPGAPNWLIGGIGEIHSAPRPFDSQPDLPNGIIDAHGTPVTPKSLYLAQLEERLGKEALANIGY